MPLMTVWPVSSSSSTWKVGSSLASFWMAHAQLLLVALGLRLDGDRDDRIREAHGLELDRVRRVGEGVTGGGVLQPDERVDVAREGLLHRVLLVGVHLEQLADALLLAGGGVQDLHALLHLAGVDAHVGQRPEERVRGDLEGEAREGLVPVGRTGQLGRLVARLVADHVGHVERRGQVVDDTVQDGLDALVLEGGAAEDRVGLRGDGHGADAGLELLDREVALLEVLVHELLGALGHVLDELAAGTPRRCRPGPRGSGSRAATGRARGHPSSS